MIRGAPASTAARNGTRSSSSDPVTVADASSVFACAPPRPGKCLGVAATPAARMPSTEGRVRGAMPAGSPSKARKPITGAGPGGTSATGVRFTFTPMALSWRAASRAARPTAAGSPCSGRPAAGPAQLTVRMSPPSWATITRASPPLHRPGQGAPLGLGAGVEAEQDHPGGLARPEAAADVVGRRGIREARDDHLADLLAEAEAVDGREGALAAPLLGWSLRRLGLGLFAVPA